MDQTRFQKFQELFPNEKPFRWKQIEEALFQVENKGWKDVTVLSKPMREVLEKEVKWNSLREIKTFISQKKDTHKAIIELEDGLRVETVLMANKRGQWTICVSSQVGCAMQCNFCSTGKMGLSRNMNVDEIVDQYLFWQQYIKNNKVPPPDKEGARKRSDGSRISNIVFMRMGEPLANFENVKETINTWLKYTDVGPTHITVSTVGVLPLLDQILKDKDWPHTRLAISLHSADPVTRKEIVPTSHKEFLPKIKEWTKKYLEQFGNRRHHLTFEYVMLRDTNDTDHHAKALAKLCNQVGNIKVNLIPYNFTDLGFTRTEENQLQKFKRILEDKGIPITIRKTMGDDIAAACGQLITLNSSSHPSK